MINKTLSIFVPSTVSVDICADSSLVNSVVAQVQRQLAENFGGFTTQNAVGGWVADNGELVIEPITIVSTFSDSPDDVLWAVGTGIATAIKSIMSQEAVTVRVNNETRFI